MAAFFAGLFAVIAALCIGFAAALFLLVVAIDNDKHFRDYLRALCDEEDAEESDNM